MHSPGASLPSAPPGGCWAVELPEPRLEGAGLRNCLRIQEAENGFTREAVMSTGALQISHVYILAFVCQLTTGQPDLRERLPWSGHWPVSQTMRWHVTCSEETLSPKAFSALGPDGTRKWLGFKILCFFSR